MGLIERLARAQDDCDPEPEYVRALRAAYLRAHPDTAPTIIARNEWEDAAWVQRARAGELPAKDYSGRK